MNKKVPDYMSKISEKGIVLGLERINELMQKLGNPQDKVKILHISGTNGKGSFSAMLSSVLTESGLKTGCFSSPALTGITDSFRINCKEISQNQLDEIMSDIVRICEGMADKPTEFEVLTACAYELFYREKCDVALVECGMGGDTDSTNIIKSPVLSVITNIQRDHTKFLGDTLSEIAMHKSGIIKHNCPIFFGGETEGEAFEIIKDKAYKLSAELFTKNHGDISDIDFSIDGTSFLYKGNKLILSLLGTYQTDNVLNVLNCVEILRKNGFDISDDAVSEGLKNANWHGRFEILCRNPLVIYDGAHNPDGIKQASDSIKTYFNEKIALLIGVMADKEYGLYADMLGEYLDHVFTVKPQNPRSLDSKNLAESFTSHGIDADYFTDLNEGVKTAYNYAKQKEIPLVILGTLYMYKEIAKII